MKKILLLAFALLMLLTGCESRTAMPVETEDKMKELYGTWAVSKVMYNDSFYTLEELKALGEDSLEGIYIVIKEGGGGYAYLQALEQGGATSWEYDEENKSLTVGDVVLVYDGGELKMNIDEESAILLSKYSDSQDFSELVMNIGEEEKAEEEPAEDVIRPEIKEAIDAYEEFVDEYCIFMEEYNDSDSADFEMLAAYAEFVSKLADMETKMDRLEDDLSEAESLYFTQVMLRCSQRLLEVY